MTIISSQRYLDENIVAEKIAAEDFEVMLSPAFEIDGETYQVILDGHHSFEAAKQAGVAPSFWVADCGDHDAIGLLETCTADDFMLAVHMGSDYYNAETGKDIW
jgi:hypothetical protein